MSDLHGILNNYIHELRNTPPSQPNTEYVTENKDEDLINVDDYDRPLNKDEQRELNIYNRKVNREEPVDQKERQRGLHLANRKEHSEKFLTKAKVAVADTINAGHKKIKEHPYAAGALTAAAIATGAGALALRKKLKEKKSGK